MAKKHTLTKKADHIDGIAGNDLFLAPMLAVNGMEKATLSNKDVLNGRGGIDTIQAFIAADTLAPTLRNIEKAVFTRHDTDTLALDLSHAAKLSSIKLKNFDSDVDISHAGRLSNFTLQNVPGEHAFSIDGINAGKVDKLSLNFINSGDSGFNTGVAISSTGAFKDMEVKLKNSAVVLAEDHGTEKLVIHSSAGANANTFYTKIDPVMDVVKSIVIDGGGALAYERLNLGGDGFSSATLESFDASAMTGDLTAHFGGDNLVSVKTGSGSDSLYLSGLGGASGAKAMIALGDGDDYINLRSIGKAVDPASLAIDGGNGHDSLSFNGALADVASVLQNFETLHVHEATGTYDLAGSGITYFNLYSQQSAVTLNHAASGTQLDLNDPSTQSVTVNVDNAAGSDTDSLNLVLNTGAFGDFLHGFNAPNLSNLTVNSYGGPNTLYLGAIGAANDAAAITVNGDQRLTLKAADGARNISEITVNSNAGIDLYDLRDQGIVKSFAASGATITGGSGNDVLVGGSGDDVINSGGGDNTIHGSLGADAVYLNLNSGFDTLVFAIAAQSTIVSADTIYNFGALDRIDLSAIAPQFSYAGEFANINEGKTHLQQGEVVGFLDQAYSNFYVDINKNGVIDVASDLMFHLDGVTDLQLFNFIW